MRVARSPLVLFACGANAAFRYAALVQEANRIKQEYKSIRAQVSARAAFPPFFVVCVRVLCALSACLLSVWQQQSFHR